MGYFVPYNVECSPSEFEKETAREGRERTDWQH